MNWNDLRYFLVLADEGTLSGAARRLRKEHTTVARRIEALEHDVGTKLFDRLPRGWQLTAAGENLVPVAERVEEEALAFERQAKGDEAAHGVVRISVPPVAGRILFAPRLARLLKAQKGLEFEIIGSSNVVNLARREADIAVRMVTPREPGLIIRKLVELGVGLYGAVGYRDRVAKRDWEYCGYDDTAYGTSKKEWVRNVLGRELPCRFRAGDTETVRQFIVAGHGVGVLPRYLGDLDDRLELIHADSDGQSREVGWMVVHPDMRRSPGVRLVMDALIKAAEEISEEFQV
ncbi:MULTISPECIES: LysR family transcriptional regulator [Thalassospira]|uniref:LysR family transcriptional regulator n=2 Tax=Thalassospira TaxID=168934 RepID=A0A367VZL7_9PROT|nr:MULTISPECIES: LysR family transcriptional regulator [Thalassospira]MDG4720318.1 LysR family transcriptional regulator [Thalassospira sp. FZY0004]RCK32188.1 LysR family transcriptional regulator [Thalassospira profundimaris]